MAVARTPANRYPNGVTQGLNAFLDYLKTAQARGVTHVTLDDSARAALRELHRRIRNPQAAHKTTHSSKQQQQPTATWNQAVAAPPAIAAPSPTTPIETPNPGTGDKATQIANLRTQAERWPHASQLGTLRDTLVFSTGNPEATLVLVGEAPGYDEEKRREPFTGPAGKKLDDILKAMGLSRSEVYITNIVKNRPAMTRQATNNRKPSAAEMHAWLPFVKAELSVIRPACIIALGATATEGLLGTSKSITAMRGNWHEFQGIPLRATYHPSYLLRTEGRLGPKRQLWEDMLAVMERLNMPISEKQRGFFLPRGQG